METLSREDARSRKLSRYFTGVACKNGHISERHVGNGQCVACRAARYDAAWQKSYNDSYREKNRDAIQAKDRARYALNPEPDKEREKRRYWANRDANLAESKKRRDANKEKYAEARKRYRDQNIDRIRSAAALRSVKNRHKISARVRAWKLQNPDKAAANHALRRARKQSAVPSWFGEFDELVWREAADVARSRGFATGKKWHVDHMIPLASDAACGLHTWNNCQVIPQSLNNRKRNRMWLTERSDWVNHL